MRKKCNRRVVHIPFGIPGMPAESTFSPIADHCATKSIKRMLTTERSPAEWGKSDMNELIFLANTVCILLKRWPEYRTPERLADGNALEATLTSIRQRRIDHGHYGVTGEQWKTLRAVVATLQTWLGTINSARLSSAEKEVYRIATINPK